MRFWGTIQHDPAFSRGVMLLCRRVLQKTKEKLFCVQRDDVQHDLSAAVHPFHGGALAHAVEVEAAGAQIGAG